ncbi:MAG: hypothetical protein NVS2B16_19970 [Chloroflexota bacterium]
MAFNAEDAFVPETIFRDEHPLAAPVAIDIDADEETDVLVIRIHPTYVDYQSFTVDPERLHERFVDLVKKLHRDQSLLDPLLETGEGAPE